MKFNAPDFNALLISFIRALDIILYLSGCTRFFPSKTPPQIGVWRPPSEIREYDQAITIKGGGSFLSFSNRIQCNCRALPLITCVTSLPKHIPLPPQKPFFPRPLSLSLYSAHSLFLSKETYKKIIKPPTPPLHSIPHSHTFRLCVFAVLPLNTKYSQHFQWSCH